MSYILYGDPDTFGSGLWLNVTGVNHYRREAVYAGPDYLYTRHNLSVRALFNPGTQQETLLQKPLSYLNQPPHVLPPDNPAVRPPFVGPLRSEKIAPHSGAPRPDKPAAYTAEAIKRVALTPRLRLRWWSDHQMLLMSPLAGLVVDSTGGPRPISCDLAEMRSGKTWLLDWNVETDINENPHIVNRPHVVLSHQFGQSEDLDQDYLRTLTTKGRVVLDRAVLETPDLLAQGTLKADDLRAQLFVPVQQNMKRERVNVSVEANGVTYNYEIVDREYPLNWDAAGVTRLEIIHEVINELPGISLPRVGDVREFVARGNAFEAVKVAAGAGGWDMLKGALGRQAANHPQLARLFGQFIGALLPGIGGLNAVDLNHVVPDALNLVGGGACLSHHSITARVHGHRGVSRNDLEQFARDILTERFIPVRVGLRAVRMKSRVRHYADRNVIEADEQYLSGPLVPLGGVLPTRTALGNRVFGDNNNTGNLLTVNPATRIPRPPHDNLSRGTHISALISSALQQPGNPRNLPPDLERNAKDAGVSDNPIWPRPTNP